MPLVWWMTVLLVSLTSERLDVVCGRKVDAAWYWHELTVDLDLTAFVLFSSVAVCSASSGRVITRLVMRFLDGLAECGGRGLPAVVAGVGSVGSGCRYDW